MNFSPQEIVFIFSIFILIAIQLNNYKLANNKIEKIFLQYLFFTSKNNKWKYYYEIMIIPIICLINLYFFKKVSLPLFFIFIFYLIEYYSLNKIMNNIKLKQTRIAINKPIDIIDIVYLLFFLMNIFYLLLLF